MKWEIHEYDENGEPIKTTTAKELGELVQKDLMDPNALNITEVELLVDLSKSQIIDKFKSLELRAKDGQKLAVIVVSIGFSLMQDTYQHSDLMTSLGADLEDKSTHHHYHLTTEGHAVNYNALCTRLANIENVACLLINQFD